MNSLTIDKNSFQKSCKEFAYRIRNCRNSAIHLGGHLVLGHTVMGDPLIVDSRHFNSLKLLYLPPPKEIAILSFLFHYIQPSMHCIDFGAGTGYYSLVLAKLTGANGKTFSFEADPGCFPILNRNVLLNNFQSIDCENALPSLDQFLGNDAKDIDFIYTSPELDLLKYFKCMQKTLEANNNINMLCHINPAQLQSERSEFEFFFETLHRLGFEGYIFPTLNFLGSMEQLTKDPSIKSLLLRRNALWQTERSPDG